jgi:hypothetical protein
MYVPLMELFSENGFTNLGYMWILVWVCLKLNELFFIFLPRNSL